MTQPDQAPSDLRFPQEDITFEEYLAFTRHEAERPGQLPTHTLAENDRKLFKPLEDAIRGSATDERQANQADQAFGRYFRLTSLTGVFALRASKHLPAVISTQAWGQHLKAHQDGLVTFVPVFASALRDVTGEGYDYLDPTDHGNAYYYGTAGVLRTVHRLAIEGLVPDEDEFKSERFAGK